MAGHPDYDVTATYDVTNKTERLIVRQTQAADSRTPIFDMPIELAFYGTGGEQKQVQVRDYLPTQEFDVPLGFQPKWIDFDPDDFIDKTLRFEQPEAALIAAAEQDRSMMSRLWAVQQLGKSSQLDEGQAVVALTRVLNQDTFYGVRAAAAKRLGSMASETAKSALLAALSQPDSRVRTAVVEALGHCSQDSAVYRALVHALQQDNSYAVAGAAAEVLAGCGKTPLDAHFCPKG